MLTLILACGGADKPAEDSAAVEVAAIDAVVTGLGFVSDASPSPDGETVYYLASDPWSLWAAPFDGAGEPEALAGFTAPRNVITDGSGETLYVSDGDGVYALPAAGGEPALVEGTERSSPEGLAWSEQDGEAWLWFSGLSPDGSGAIGLHRLPLGGGEVQTLAEGSPFYSPEGVALDEEGTAWVCDSAAGEGPSGALIRVRDGVATVLIEGFEAGNPCGIALAAGGGTALISAIDAEGHSQLLLVDTASGETRGSSEEVGENVGSGGMHGAREVPGLYAWTGLRAGGEGVVHRVELE